jgi:hypothetical protein
MVSPEKRGRERGGMLDLWEVAVRSMNVVVWAAGNILARA